MSARFKVGLSRDLLDGSGAPSFGRAALATLDANPAIDWEFVPEAMSEVTPDVAACYDALYVNTPKVTAASANHSVRTNLDVAREVEYGKSMVMGDKGVGGRMCSSFDKDPSKWNRFNLFRCGNCETLFVETLL